MPIRAITFDLDDTLWPIAPVIARAERLMHRWLAENCPQVARSYSIESLQQMRMRLDVQRPELGHDFGLMRRTVLRQVMEPLGYDAEMIEAAYQVFYAARNQVELYPDVKPALARLSGRYRLAGLSNGNADLEHIGLGRFLRFSIHAFEVGYLKPHPKMFQAAAERLALPVNQILHVGDHLEHDVAGAQRAGMRAVWMNRGGQQAGPDHGWVISTLEQLPELIDSMC